jgi:hypothetical protein
MNKVLMIAALLTLSCQTKTPPQEWKATKKPYLQVSRCYYFIDLEGKSPSLTYQILETTHDSYIIRWWLPFNNAGEWAIGTNTWHMDRLERSSSLRWTCPDWETVQ